VVASRECSPTVRALRAENNVAEIGILLNPSDYARPGIVGFDSSGQLTAFAKFAARMPDRRRQEHELKILQSVRAMPRLRDHVPAVIGQARGVLGDALILSALRGKPAPEHLTPSLRGWLTLCQQSGEVAVENTDIVRAVFQELSDARNDISPLQAAATAALAELAGVMVRPTVVHGDFVPWNIFVDNEVPRIFDWERGTMLGLPGWDEVYYRLQTGLVVGGWSAATLLREARDISRHVGVVHWFGRSVPALTMLVLVRLCLSSKNQRVTSRIRESIAHLDVQPS
jgi:hypothetical protein